jgi:putative ABC transport system permease protein
VRLRELRSVIVGEAGFRLALALAFVAALTSFITMSGPREQTANQDGAIRTAVSQLAPVNRSIELTASWNPEAGYRPSFLTPDIQSLVGGRFSAHFGPLISVQNRADRAFASGPLLQVPRPELPAATLLKPPTLQLSVDSGLTADARLLSGTWPTATSRLPGRSAAARNSLVLQVVLTKATASRFAQQPGSVIKLGPIAGRQVALLITGIVQPRPGAIFWDSGAVQTRPALVGNSEGAWYLGGAIAGEDELQAIQNVWPGVQAFGEWYYPISLRDLTSADLGRLAAAIAAVTASSAASSAASGSGFTFAPPEGASSQLPAALTAIRAQVTAASGIDELVIGGLFAACLLLMLLCAGLAADRYGPELALISARGGSTGQVVARTLARALWVCVPGIAAGLALASRLGAPTASQWALPAVNATVAIAAVPARCAWRAGKNRSWEVTRRTKSAAPRMSPRRIVAEVSVLAIAAGAVVALRLRGVAGGSDQLGIAAPVLVATVASIVIGRLYPIPVRGMLLLANRRRGPVSFLGLSQAGRAGLATIVPALALVLTLTLAAFGVMLTQSVATGQIASTWAKTGADAIFTAPGNNVVTTTAQGAVDTVPGVRHTAAAYVEASTNQTSNFLMTVSGGTVALGIAIVNPPAYGALARDTPWPAFPVAALAQRPGPVPILVSAAAAAADPGLVTSGPQTLSAYGIKIAVRVAGTLGTTPAFPAGGTFIVYPQWAAAQIASVPGPNELLATGPRLSVPRLRAVASLHLHGDGLLLRSTLLNAQLSSAAEYAVRLFDLGGWAAAALSAVALFFGLGATAHARRTLRTRMSAMGMPTRQARALALFDPLALLATAIAGMTMAVGLLTVISRQVIPLQSLTSSATSVPVTLSLTALAIPAAGVMALAFTVITAEHVLAIRSETATALRYEEAG